MNTSKACFPSERAPRKQKSLKNPFSKAYCTLHDFSPGWHTQRVVRNSKIKTNHSMIPDSAQYKNSSFSCTIPPVLFEEPHYACLPNQHSIHGFLYFSIFLFLYKVATNSQSYMIDSFCVYFHAKARVGNQVCSLKVSVCEQVSNVHIPYIHQTTDQK